MPLSGEHSERERFKDRNNTADGNFMVFSQTGPRGKSLLTSSGEWTKLAACNRTVWHQTGMNPYLQIARLQREIRAGPGTIKLPLHFP